MEKCIIAAVAEDGAIGRDNGLIWHLSGDLKYFKSVTLGSPVIMGRKTFESIGRPLPGRRNIVVSGTLPRGRMEFPQVRTAPSHIEVVGSLDEAFSAAGTPADGGAEVPERCFVIGGAQLYAEAMALADRLYITRIHASAPDADRFFPAIEASLWREDSISGPVTDPETGIRFSFAVYVRNVE